MTELLTENEHLAIQAAGDLWGMITAIVEEGPPRESDLAELIIHIHAIQHAVMANAAARAYPTQLRRLGATLKPDGPSTAELLRML